MVLLYTLDSQVDSTALKVDQGALKRSILGRGSPHTKSSKKRKNVTQEL